MPYYEKNKNVQNFFARLLQSKDNDVKLNTVVLMLRNDKSVADSIVLNLAANERYSSTLFHDLEKIKKLHKFPSQYKTQINITRSSLAKVNEFDKLDSMVYLEKKSVTVKGKSGLVYFFKYRVKPTDQWRIGISGLQPENMNEVSSECSIVSMTDVKLKENEPVTEQLNTQLRKILFGLHKSGKNFYNDNDRYSDMKAIDEYED